MNLKEAIQVLQTHQDWRLGKHDNQTDPKLLTEALDIAIRMLIQLN